jgi:Fe2+ transport system protein FeoA
MLNLIFWRSAHPINTAGKNSMTAIKAHTLAQAAAGQKVTITGFGRLSPAHRQHLQAYGLLPGRSVQVLAQNPVTIVLVEHTELAFENEISAQVLVE